MVTDLTCLARPCWSIDANTHSPDRQAADGRQSDLTLSIAAKKSATSAKAGADRHYAQASGRRLISSHDLPTRQAQAVLGDLVTLTTRHLREVTKSA